MIASDPIKSPLNDLASRRPSTYVFLLKYTVGASKYDNIIIPLQALWSSIARGQTAHVALFSTAKIAENCTRA